MQHTAVKKIRQSVDIAQRMARESGFDSCDAADLDEVIELLKRELQRPLPNDQTVSTYMSSLLRSLRSEPAARDVYLQLEEAVRGTGLSVDASLPLN